MVQWVSVVNRKHVVWSGKVLVDVHRRFEIGLCEVNLGLEEVRKFWGFRGETSASLKSNFLGKSRWRD
ncbi:hypothetical protein Hanom_Chr14g01264691 [Helianthus anomalus]